ncbi:unnamed protein product [Polarella glacialis]|uniref:Uncharacterized protein n=1 Tax=Polarella glacialis TaxID=89957 RepID=A0A813D855_POLGL|nr:unnamed protein product [Polarella glacialis]
MLQCFTSAELIGRELLPIRRRPPLQHPDGDVLELLLVYFAVLFFTVFILNIFIGIISEAYIAEKDFQTAPDEQNKELTSLLEKHSSHVYAGGDEDGRRHFGASKASPSDVTEPTASDGKHPGPEVARTKPVPDFHLQFADLMGKAAETFGRVDVLVANAGTGNGKLLVGTPFEELDELMESQISVNLLGGLRCVTAAAQLMSSDGLGGRISIVSSAAGLISLPGYAIYSATKFGHRGFLAGAYHEFRRHGVHLSVYYPGSIRTPGFQQEQEACPRVTARIEAQCSEISSAESVAAVLLKGIESGAREITNELLPSLVVDSPTGCAPIDALIGAVASQADLCRLVSVPQDHVKPLH